jgi:hypothetical protein
MPRWAQYLIALAALVIAAPAVALWAKRHGGRVRGGIGIAALMLGFGEVMDPPSKHLIEANEGEEKQTPTPGDPPET